MAKAKEFSGIVGLKAVDPHRRSRGAFIERLKPKQQDELLAFREQYRKGEWDAYPEVQLYEYWQKLFSIDVQKAAFISWLKRGK